MAQKVENMPAMQETWVRSLGLEDPLEEKIATHSSILAWRIPWTEEPGGQQSMGLQRVRHDLGAKTATTTQNVFCKEGVREFESFFKSLEKKRLPSFLRVFKGRGTFFSLTPSPYRSVFFLLAEC